jgi:hypothetical protein
MKLRTISLFPVHSQRLLTAICALLALSVSSTFAAEDKAIDPRADEFIRRMGEYLGQAKFFSVNAEIWQDIQLASGQQIQAGRNLELQVKRPNRLRAEVHSPRRDRTLVYDGSSITLLNRAQNFYGTIHAPGNIDDAMDAASDKFGIAMPLEDFVTSDPHKDLLEKVTSGRDIGAVNVMGVSCEHLVFTQNNLDWQVWIENGAKPVPRKFVITYKDEPDSPEFTAIFSNWDFTTQLPDFLFKFEPPPGSSQIQVKAMREETQSHQTEKQRK